MSELGVTDTQFVEACEKASLYPIHKKIVDQIMAVDNFMAFKRLMIKRNSELATQAAAMLATTENREQTPTTTTATPSKDKELEAMREAYRVAQELEKEEEEEMIRKAIEESEKMQND